MADTSVFPNYQDQAASAIPVQLAFAGQFYQAGGGSGGSTAPYAGTPLGFQTLTPTTSTALTVPATATYAYVTAEAQDVRWRDDGTAPTASTGMRIYAGQPQQLFSGAAELAAVRFIQVTTGAILNVSYYK